MPATPGGFRPRLRSDDLLVKNQSISSINWSGRFGSAEGSLSGLPEAVPASWRQIGGRAPLVPRPARVICPPAAHDDGLPPRARLCGVTVTPIWQSPGIGEASPRPSSSQQTPRGPPDRTQTKAEAILATTSFSFLAPFTLDGCVPATCERRWPVRPTIRQACPRSSSTYFQKPPQTAGLGLICPLLVGIS